MRFTHERHYNDFIDKVMSYNVHFGLSKGQFVVQWSCRNASVCSCSLLYVQQPLALLKTWTQNNDS